MKPKKLGKLLKVDAETGRVLEEKNNAFTLLPPSPNTCPECAVEHDYFRPHNQQSLCYQMQFYSKHGRWPTWTDAMAHCPEDIRKQCRKLLIEQMIKYNLKIPADLTENPASE